MWSKTVILAALILAWNLEKLAAEMPKAKGLVKVEINANRMRFTKVAGGDWDDRTQRVQLEVIARNLDYNRPLEGMTLHYWVLAESLVDRKALKVIDAGEIPLNLTSKPDGRELRQKCDLFTLMWDDTNAVFGQRYKGWLLVVLNAQKEVVAVKSNAPSFQINFERAFTLREGSWCQLDLSLTQNPGGR